MIITLTGGKTQVFQWDSNVKLTIDVECDTMHFVFNGGTASVAKNSDGTFYIPNLLLQTAGVYTVYAYDVDNTRHAGTINVIARTKPGEYVYTETEVRNFNQISTLVAQYFTAHANEFKGPKGDQGDPYTASEEFQTLAAQVSAASASASGSKTAAAASATSAASSADSASESASAAASSATNAASYASAVAEAKIAAQNAQAGAGDYYNLTTAAKNAAVSAKDAALASKLGAIAAQEAAEAAQESAETASEAASESATNAFNSADEAAASATQAAATVASVTTQISELSADIVAETSARTTADSHLSHSIAYVREKLENVIHELNGISYREIVDSDSAQTKAVAKNSTSGVMYTDGVERYASLDKLGGMSRKCKNLFVRMVDAYISGVDGSESSNPVCSMTDFIPFTSNVVVSNAQYDDIKENIGYAYRFAVYDSDKTCIRRGSQILVKSYTVSKSEYPDGAYVRISVPKTVESTQMVSYGACDYEPYTANLIDAKVDKVVSVSKNLVFKKIDNANIESDGKIANSQNQYDLIVAEVKKGESYAFGNPLYVRAYYLTDPKLSSVSYDSSRIVASVTSFVSPIDGYVCARVGIGTNVQIEKGSTASTTYTPYFRKETTIPTSVIALCPDYGIGLSDDCYNYIDFGSKKYIQSVKSITKTFTTSVKDSSGTLWNIGALDGVVSTMNQSLQNVLCAEYKPSGLTDGRNNDISIVLFGGKVYIHDDSFTGTFRKEMTIYYELAEPIEVDLSSVLDDDLGMIEVEGGGTVSFHSPALDSGYVVDNPSTITYDVDISQFGGDSE